MTDENTIKNMRNSRSELSKLKLELADAIASKSKLTEKDALELGEKIKDCIARRHGLIK